MPSLRALALALLALPLANLLVHADLAGPAGHPLALKSRVEALLDAAADSLQDCLHNHQILSFQKEHPAVALAPPMPELVKRQSANTSANDTSPAVSTSLPPSTPQSTSSPSPSPLPSTTAQTPTPTSAATAATPTTTSPSSPQQTSTTPELSSTTPVLVNVTFTTTDSAGSTIAVASSALVGATAAVTTTDSEGKPTVQPGVIVTKTNSAGLTVTVTSAADAYSRATYTSGQVVTRTSGASIFETTYTPDSVSSIVLSTTTLPDGERSTLTSFATVDASRGRQAPGGTATEGAPSLQTGAACKMARVEAAAALAGGVFGLAWLF